MVSQVESIKWLPDHTDRRFMVDGFAFKNRRCQVYFLTQVPRHRLASAACPCDD